MSVPVRIRRLRPDVPLPRYQTPAAAGFDLAASEEIVVGPGEIKLVPTGLVIEVPEGYCLAIVARSSTPLRRGLMMPNAVGIVDADYAGPEDEILIEVYNFTAAPVRIAPGDRIAQGLLVPVARAEWREEAELKPVSRGGFGSTG
ncbi:MAG TPA: dUTP diphosphatase [Vicinamibacterales bacterium]|jgi:dUTP pyrophosphatase|nr:dUTP diphosphatase [Vicinamibacterales bacterium]